MDEERLPENEDFLQEYVRSLEEIETFDNNPEFERWFEEAEEDEGY